MRDYFDLKNEFSSMVEKARIELKGDCPLIEDAAILAASERIAELESMLVSRTKEVDDGIKRYNKSVSKQQKIIAELEKELAKTKQPQKSGWLRDSNTHVNKSKEQDE